jgi:hypothetical protein
MSDHVKNIARLRDQSNFLGFEFLSWLFLLLDHEKSQEQVSQITKDIVFKTDVQVVLGNKLVTCLFTHREQKTSVASPLLEASHEVFASLRNGHLVESLALNIALAEITIGLTLHATDFAFTQVKIKNNYQSESLTDDEELLSEQDKNQEEIFLRCAALEDAERVINGLYEHWIRLRMNSRDQAREIARMRHQIEERLGSYIAKAGTRHESQVSALSG